MSVWVMTSPLTIAVARISVGRVVPNSSGLEGRRSPVVVLIAGAALSGASWV